MPKILLIVGVVLVVVAAGYFGLASVLHKIDTPSLGSPTGQSVVSGQTQPASQAGIDQALVGNWATDCLIPDPNSPWAEKHTFTLNANGTGNHTRSSGQTCDKLTPDLDDNFNFTTPTPGQINLAYTSGMVSGMTIYDMYQASGNTLEFGHGFCNCTTTGGLGTDEGSRLSRLNKFLVYKKQ